jgi:glycosyltransferase involved in cell wall biosynthesis
MFSKEKLPPKQMNMLYNLADCTICVSDAEGFGLSAMESLACGTPLISTLTGGLQEQITDGKNTFGIGLKPVSKAIIGSLSVPWIYEDRVSGEDVVDAMFKMYKMSNKDREKLGDLGIKHIQDNYNFEKFQEKWVEIMLEVYEKYGSWENRRNHDNRWECIEI